MKKVSYLIVLGLLFAFLWSGCEKDDETPALSLTAFSPATGESGTNVTLTGTNFSTTAASNVVTFNGTVATVTTATATSLTVSAPAGASSGKITVQANGQTATSTDDFVYIPTVTVSTLAGSSTDGFADGTGTAAQFKYPIRVAVDASGNVYVADFGNNRIRKITAAGVVSTLAGNGTKGFADGSSTTAQFSSPTGVAVDASGNVYVADTQNHRIRKITAAGVVSTLAGNGTSGFANGSSTTAQFFRPEGVAVDASGNVYVADTGNTRIRKITAGGVVSTLASSGTDALFSNPSGVAVDASGNVYVAEHSNNRIRKITTGGVVSTLAGSGTEGFADGSGTDALFSNPNEVAMDASGNVYVADTGNNRIRKIQ